MLRLYEAECWVVRKGKEFKDEEIHRYEYGCGKTRWFGHHREGRYGGSWRGKDAETVREDKENNKTRRY